MKTGCIDGLFFLPSFLWAQEAKKWGSWAHRQLDLPSEGGLIRTEKLGPICTAIAKHCTRTRRRMLSSTLLSIARRWTRGDDEREVSPPKTPGYVVRLISGASLIGVASNRNSGDSRGTVFSHSLVTKHPISDIQVLFSFHLK